MGKAIKVPKKVAGVKIPKSLRKGPVGNFLNSSAGQLLIAEALLAMVAALAVRRTDSGERGAVALGRRAAELGSQTQQSVRVAGERFAEAFRAGIAAFRDSLQEGTGPMEVLDEPAVATGEEDSLKKSPASGVKRGPATH
jgi:hypothetical protein